MAWIAVRRGTAPPAGSVVGAVVLGLGLGALIGFVLGEVAGPAARRAVVAAGREPAERPLVATLVAAAQAALDDDLMLHECGLTVRATGPGRIELHGWVTDRRSRARAAQLVRDAVRAGGIVNCLMVRGEDDRLAPAGEASGERLA